MDLTLFGDAIISQTDLKTDQKKWFDRANKSPVSITGPKGKSFVLINREQAQNTFSTINYAVKILEYFKAIRDSRDSNSTLGVFPWAVHLNDKERNELANELITAFNECLHSNDWTLLEETIKSWKATAEALTNSRFTKIIGASEDTKEYTSID
jgi:hypothetical protein